MKIRFIEDYAPKDGSGRMYTVDQEFEVREDSARHFISRRKAVAVDGEIAAPAAPKAPDSSFTDAAEERHEKKRGRKPAAISGTSDFETGDDA